MAGINIVVIYGSRWYNELYWYICIVTQKTVPMFGHFGKPDLA